MSGRSPLARVASIRIMTRRETLDLYFLAARHQLIEVAAFMDRVDHAPGEADFRWAAFVKALRCLETAPAGERAAAVLMALSDPTTVPVERAPGKGAVGAWEGPAS